MNKTKLTAILVAAGFLLAGVVAIPAISASPSKQISGCVSTKTGVLRITNTCKPGERRMSWLTQSAVGENGLQGLQGIQGLQGLPGSPGASGTSGLNFANNCYQWYRQAESSGFLWGSVADRTRFETLTGCSLRSINSNPYAHIPEIYANTNPKVSNTQFLGVVADSYADQFYVDVGTVTGLYEVFLTKPNDKEICSTGREPGGRAIQNDLTGKTYSQSRIERNLGTRTAVIEIGIGSPANTGSQTTNVGSGVGSTFVLGYSYSTQIVFESFPTVMPLGDTFELRVLQVKHNGIVIPKGSYEMFVDPGNLIGVSRKTDVAGVDAVLELQANDLERGMSNLSFQVRGNRVSGGNTYPFENWVMAQTNVGVTSCVTSYDTVGNYFQFTETSPISAASAALATGIGWTSGPWFGPESGFVARAAD